MTAVIYSRMHESPLIINAVLRKVGRQRVPEVDHIELPAKRTVINDCFDGLAYLGNPVLLLVDPAHIYGTPKCLY
jgi:hypothetical protein